MQPWRTASEVGGWLEESFCTSVVPPPPTALSFSVLANLFFQPFSGAATRCSSLPYCHISLLLPVPPLLSRQPIIFQQVLLFTHAHTPLKQACTLRQQLFQEDTVQKGFLSAFHKLKENPSVCGCVLNCTTKIKYPVLLFKYKYGTICCKCIHAFNTFLIILFRLYLYKCVRFSSEAVFSYCSTASPTHCNSLFFQNPKYAQTITTEDREEVRQPADPDSIPHLEHKDRAV